MRSFKSLYQTGLALALATSLYFTGCGGSSGGGSSGGNGNKPTLEVSISKDSYLRGEQVCVDGSVTGTKDFGWDPNSAVGFNGLTGTLKGCFQLSYDSPLTRQDLVAYAGSLEKSVSFTPLNNPPVANAGGDIAVPKNIPFTIDATKSFDVDGTITNYELDLEGDGTYEDSNTTGIFNIAGYPFDGCYNSTIRVTDNNGSKDTDSILLFVGSGC